jgi:inosose dehydratase
VLRAANAPCSYGAFEETVGVHPGVPEPEAFLEAVREAGYEGTELGPLGYLGDPHEVAERLARHELELVGAFVPMRLSDRDGFHEDLGGLERTLDVFRAAGAPDAKVVLADAGSNERRARVGAARLDRSHGLAGDSWQLLAASVRHASSVSEAAGFEAVFHPHAGTYVEAGWEVDMLLDLTDVRLVFDPGHASLAGDDAPEVLRRWRDRVGHVHVKDVDETVLATLEPEFALADAWSRGVFCGLGQGCAGLEELVARLLESGYDGWVVVEQDHIPTDAGIAAPAAAQAENRAWLRRAAGI